LCFISFKIKHVGDLKQVIFTYTLTRPKLYCILNAKMPIRVAARSLGVGLRPLACWDCGFESRLWHGYLSVVGVLLCQVEISVTGRSVIQRSRTEFGVSECDTEASTMRRLYPTMGCRAMNKKIRKFKPVETAVFLDSPVAQTLCKK
jgi:hypothetical protein